MTCKNKIEILFVWSSCLLSTADSISQTATGRRKVLEVQIVTDSGGAQGYVANITDSTVTMSGDVTRYNDSITTDNEGLYTIDYRNIISISRVKKGSVLIGALAGAAAGALIGLATYQEPASNGSFTLDLGPGPPAALGGLLGGIAGTLVGVAIHKETFQINKDKNEFQTFKLYVLGKSTDMNMSK